MWKDFFYYSKTEKRTIILLLVLLVPAVVFYFLSFSSPQDEVDEPLSLNGYSDFMTTLSPDTAKRFKKRYGYAPKNRVRPVLKPFDPNRIDSAAFVHLGLPSWMAKNIMRYRAKGGVFRTPESFARVYGLSTEQYQELLPYITIRLDDSFSDSLSFVLKDAKRDSLSPFKYEKGVLVDINAADTTELKKIPGIGSYLANRIVGYRTKLGGYYSLSQLGELQLNVQLLSEWLFIGDAKLQSVCVNKWSLERLKSHPYIDFYQAKVMVEHRRKRGGIYSINELKMYDEFDEESIKRLEKYLNFEK